MEWIQKTHTHSNGFPINPMVVCGEKGKTGKFHGSFFSVLAHDANAWTWNKNKVYTSVHERGCHPKFRMGDGAPAITKAGEEVFERRSENFAGQCFNFMGSAK